MRTVILLSMLASLVFVSTPARADDNAGSLTSNPRQLRDVWTPQVQLNCVLQGQCP